MQHIQAPKTGYARPVYMFDNSNRDDCALFKLCAVWRIDTICTNDTLNEALGTSS